jgi:hypothetical protein
VNYEKTKQLITDVLDDNVMECLEIKQVALDEIEWKFDSEHIADLLIKALALGEK